MTPKEMIEVLQAYERGEKIEERVNGTDQYVQEDEPIWDFYGSDYRIVQKPKVKRKYHACIDVASGRLIFEAGDGSDHEHNPKYWIRVPALDQEVEIEDEEQALNYFIAKLNHGNLYAGTTYMIDCEKRCGSVWCGLVAGYGNYECLRQHKSGQPLRTEKDSGD